MNYLLWQLADSGFPAGGFAHSGGLEAAMHHGALDKSGSVRAFARHTVLQAARSALPLVSAAHRDPETLGDLDLASVAQPVPLIDLFQSTHDRLYSRLFQS